MTALVLLILAASGPPPPQVIGPRVSESTVVTYRFRSSTNGVRFRCAVDEARMRACRSPYGVRLGIGPHTLRVRAVDSKGRTSRATRVRIRILQRPAPEVRVGVAPLDVIATGETLWTENYGDGTVSIVDASTRSVRSVQVGGVPGGIAYGAGTVWVTDFGDGTVTRMDTTGRVVARISLAGQSSGIAIDGGTAYVADYTCGLWRIGAAPDALPRR